MYACVCIKHPGSNFKSMTQEVPKNSKRIGSFLRGLHNAPSFPGIIEFNCLFMKNGAGVLAFGFWLLAFGFHSSLLW